MGCARSFGTGAAIAALVLALAAAAMAAPARKGAAGATSAPTAKAPPAGDPLAERLCEALQALPQKRKAECCATSPAGGLAGECTRMLSASLRDGAIALDAADVEACERASARDLEGCGWVTPLMPRTPDGCRDIVHGRVASGAACRSSVECADGLFCRGAGAGAPGLCLPPAPPGATCGGAPDILATYARQTDVAARHPECAGSCLRGRCVAPVAIGGACSSNAQCAAGAHCAAGKCAAGGPPTLGEECRGTSCDDGLACIAGRCAPRKKAGEPCDGASECEAACVRAADGGAGTCGMKCSDWPPAGYTPPLYASPKSSAAGQKSN
ncbi:MAG TPA: EB domain-containing protein [Candidatus Binatia bacterium]|nr:EB domain-containing protein [Candidatus Binatia bacterium]